MPGEHDRALDRAEESAHVVAVAGIETWQELSPHSAITFALGAGAALRDVQDYAGHKDPRTPGATTTPGTAWNATPPTR